MIPKKIHYCWFGNNEMPEQVKKYISSWKKYCPDYEIVEWNESNFDIHQYKYTEEAYNEKKWAFVTDVVRLYVMVNYGGIYMDTDVEVLKPLDEFLDLKAFSGFETNNNISTGIMACEKGFPLFSELLKRYENRPFILPDGSLDTSTNVIEITNVCLSKGLKQDNTLQTIEGFTLFPADYFCPKDYSTGEINITSRTYTVHHFNGSWLSKTQKKEIRLRNWLVNHFGDNKGSKLFLLIGFPLIITDSVEKRGFIGAIKNTINK